ncbi:MAG: hypothetical protein V2A65_09275 [Candidatus Omnitrophota bacterium]
MNRGNLFLVFCFSIILLGLRAPLYAELTLVSCEPDKVYYEPGETVKISVEVKNGGDEETTNNLRISVKWNLADRKEFGLIPISLKPGEILRTNVSWVPQEESWGCEITGELLNSRDGTVLTRKSETCAVHHTPFAVGQHVGIFGAMTKPGQGFFANLGGFRWPAEELMETARRYYATWCEQFAWAPSDFDYLAPKEETWWSGNGYYLQSKAGIKNVIDEGHRRGIRAFMYTWNGATVLPGLEFARQHPEWIQRTSLGQFVGRYDQRFFEVEVPLIINEDSRGGEVNINRYLTVDVYDPAAIDFTTREVIRSIEMFGWDGIRFDGHWVLEGISWDGETVYGYDGCMQAHGQDPDLLSLRNMKRGTENIHKFFPKFLFGYNYGVEYQAAGARQPKTFDFCAKDGVILWESSRCMYREGDPNHTWDAALDAFRRETDITRKAGGYEYVISPDQGPVSFAPGFARHYLPALYASGAHLFAVAFTDEASRKHYPDASTEEAIPIHRFAMRYSRFLYDRAIRFGIPAGSDFKIAGEGLWRSDLVTTQPGFNKNELFVVCHILGKRATDTINPNDKAEPVPVTQSRVSLALPASLKILEAYLVAPEKEPVSIEYESGVLRQTLILPDTPYWSMLVIRLKRM